jgi:hypothetical protein
VRAAVARHGGAEIKTEGDSFLVVFPSASGAVMCGVAIVADVADANERRAERPIEVGIGIHAGEAIETSGSYIGAAVNLASRVCAIARAGEVLVTGTVRGITQAAIPVSFTPRGRKRLKGIDEPVDVYAVTDSASAPAARRPRSRLLALGALVVAGVVVAAALAWTVGRPGWGSPGLGTLAVGPLDLGAYTVAGFEPSLRFEVTDPGWNAYRDGPDAVGLTRPDVPQGVLDVGRIDAVLQDACMPDGPQLPGGPSPSELLSALEGLTHVDIFGEPRDVTVGGRRGMSLDVSIDEGAQAACGGFGTTEVVLFRMGDEQWGARAGERFRLTAVDVGGTTITFLMSRDDSPAASVQALEAFFEYAQRVIDSAVF